MTHPIVKLRLPLLATLIAGCATLGTSFGSTTSSANPPAVDSRSPDTVSGAINALLADGSTYSGRYFQITQNTTVDSIGPLWAAGWNSAWAGRGGWGYWNAEPSPDFIKQYTGWVVANLGAPGSDRVRCKFHFVHPADGIAGGGTGQCQTPDGQTVDATFSSA
jgi:hypothetical protein